MENKIKTMNIKFKTDKEKEIHSKFKAKCALDQVDMSVKILELLKEYGNS